MMAIIRKEIVKPYLLLCEGRDAEGFLINYLGSEALSQDKRFSNEIQVMNFGGNSDLDNFIMNLKNMENFDQVRSLAIVRDAEKNYNKACNEIVRSLRKSNIACPSSCGEWVQNNTQPSVGYMLFPLNNKEGTLEDLCIKILAETNSSGLLSSIDEYLAELEKAFGRTYRRKHKNKLHTYLSTSDKYVTMPLGMASKAGAFDWNSTCLDPLNIFLSTGLNFLG